MSKNLNRIVSILICVSILITGVCFILGCISIYRSGDAPFTRASVGAVLKKIAIPIIVTVCLSVIGSTLDFFAPIEQKNKHAIQHRMLVDSLNRKRNFKTYTGEGYKEIAAEKTKRLIVNIFLIILIVTCFTLFLIYALNINNYDKYEMNTSMINAMRVFLITCAVPFLFSVFTVIFNELSYKKQSKIMLNIIKNIPNSEAAESKAKLTKDVIITIVTVAIIILAIALIVIGAILGGEGDVLAKAANICQECIGIG